MEKTAKVLLFFLLLASLMFRNASAQDMANCQNGGTTNTLAPWYCSQINQAVASIWSEWEPIGLIAVLLAFLIATVILMFGITLRNEGLKNFGIGEIYEAAATALIVIFFLMISAILFGIIPSFVTGPVNPYSTALTYINNTINTTQGAITNLYNVVMVDSYYGSIILDIKIGSAPKSRISAISTLVNPFAQTITSFFIIPAQAISDLLMDGLLALTAQFYMILFFMYLSIPVFLIPGVIFRSIFPLRSIGGMLMGVAISFYLVMPILFSIAYYFTNTGAISQLTEASAAVGANGQGTKAQTNANSPMAPLVLAVNGLRSSMGGYFLSILFYPALILMLTYYSTTVIADFIGGISKRTGKMMLL
jgi:hypothetical protein